MSLTLHFSTFSKSPARAVLDATKRASKKRIRDLRVYDLMIEDGNPIAPAHGVYFFFSSRGTCLYVGKNSSQSFVERIPWHFAMGRGAWMNHFLQRVCRFQLEIAGKPTDADLAEAARAARSAFLLLMPVSGARRITKLEKFFRLFLAPEYNSYSTTYEKRYANLKLTDRIATVLGKL